MAKKPKETIPFPKLQAYLKNSIEIHEGALTVAQMVRVGIKWVFDFLRNILISGFLLFIAKRADNTVLSIFAYTVTALLFSYVWSYLDTVLLRPFHSLKNQRVAIWLDGAFHLIVIGALSIGSMLLLIMLVDEISESHLHKNQLTSSKLLDSYI